MLTFSQFVRETLGDSEKENVKYGIYLRKER